MSIAVSILSPVNTQNLIPDSVISFIVSLTSSYKESSTTDAPIISKFTSYSS